MKKILFFILVLSCFLGIAQTELQFPGKKPLPVKKQIAPTYIEAQRGAFPSPYCGPLEFPQIVEPITRVVVAGIDNVSSAGYGSDSHEDFTNLMGAMTEGMTYSISLEGRSENYGSSFTVFIDWNQNNIMDNASERYNIGLLEYSTGTDGIQVIGNIEVPAGVIAGPTRMRVIKRFDSAPPIYVASSCNPAALYGQAEDYTINVSAAGGAGFPAPYCNVDFPDVLPITRVLMAGIDNSSSAVIGGSLAHEDFTAITGAMTEGVEYPIALEGNTDGAENTASFSVFVDFNQNGSLDDVGEKFDLGTITGSTGTDGQQAVGNILVPAGVIAGAARMRVLKRNTDTANPEYPLNSCDPNSTLGQAEDYRIQLTTAGYDNCSGAISVACGDSVIGETFTATDSGGQNGTPDVFYKITGEDNTRITLSLCEIYDFDTVLSVYDDCDLANLIATNDDGPNCGGMPQSELTFGSRTGVTYYILIEGLFNTGTFSLDVSCATYTGDGSCPGENPNDGTFETGFNCSAATAYRTANDLIVPADQNFTLNQITASIFSNGLIENVDVIYHENDYGIPGTVLYSELGIVPTTQTVIGNNSGLNVNEIVVDVSPYLFEGMAGEDTFYWIELSVTNTAGDGSVYWVSTTSTMEGYPAVVFDNSWDFPNPNADGVYIFNGTCSSLGISDEQLTGFLFYPNPANTVLNLIANENIHTVSLYNLMGQEVFHQEINATESKLEISSLPIGVYIMKVSSNGQIGAYKVLKN